jgi:hypothetical protein
MNVILYLLIQAPPFGFVFSNVVCSHSSCCVISSWESYLSIALHASQCFVSLTLVRLFVPLPLQECSVSPHFKFNEKTTVLVSFSLLQGLPELIMSSWNHSSLGLLRLHSVPASLKAIPFRIFCWSPWHCLTLLIFKCLGPSTTSLTVLTPKVKWSHLSVLNAT